MRVTCLISFVFAWLAVFAVHRAHADSPGGLKKPEAIEHFTKGNALYKAGEFDEAVKEYKAGMLVEPSAVFNFNLGQSYRQLGDYRQAKWHYERYLHSGLATAQERDAITNLITKMDAELQQKAKTEPPTEPAPSSVATPPTQPNQAVTSSGTPSHWYQDGLGWGIAGTGLAAGAVAGVLFLQAADLRDDADAASTADQAAALHEKADTRTLAGSITGISAAAIFTMGVIKLSIHSPDQRPDSISWTVGVSARGAWVSGRF